MLLSDANDGLDYTLTGKTLELPVYWSTSLWVAAIQVTAAYFCFGAAKFACKILIQNFSFTFALTLVGPVAINLLIFLCGLRNADPCAFYGTIPDYLFYEIPPGEIKEQTFYYNSKILTLIWFHLIIISYSFISLSRMFIYYLEGINV